MQTPPAGRYRIDVTRSEVTFRTTHMFGLGKVEGRFPLRSGAVEVDGAGGARVVAEIEAAGFHTGNPARDGMVRSDVYLDAAHHPVLRFTADGVTDDARLDGELTVREVTRPLRPDIEIRAGGDGFSAVARVRVDRREFGLTAQPGLTGRYLDVTVSVVAVLA